jgi:hypothetical protein
MQEFRHPRGGGKFFGKGGDAMRALLCHCRQHLEAENDAALCAVVREHLIVMHPTLEPSRDQVEEIVATRAYDLEYKEIYPDVDFAFEPR